jgi:hypothetical protein
MQETIKKGVESTVEDPEHRKSTKVRYGLEPVKEPFLALGDSAPDFLKGLKDRHPHQCGFQARYILRLKEHYHCQEVKQRPLEEYSALFKESSHG